MRFALDYDGTYSEAPELWDAFIKLARQMGHEVVCVTMRHPYEKVTMPIDVVYTCRAAKVRHCAEQEISIDVWIDDSPHWLMQDSA